MSETKTYAVRIESDNPFDSLWNALKEYAERNEMDWRIVQTERSTFQVCEWGDEPACLACGATCRVFSTQIRYWHDKDIKLEVLFEITLCRSCLDDDNIIAKAVVKTDNHKRLVAAGFGIVEYETGGKE